MGVFSQELEEVLDDVRGYIPIFFLLLAVKVILTILNQ